MMIHGPTGAFASIVAVALALAPRGAAAGEIPPGPQVTLEEALRAAASRNLSLAAAEVEVERAEANLYMSWAGLLPAASGSMTLTHKDHADEANLGPSSVTIRNQDDLASGIDVKLPLVSPQAWLGVRAGKDGVAVAEVATENVREMVLLAVAQAYYQALSAKALIAVQESQLAAASEHLAVAEARLENGVAKRVEVIRAKSELARIKEALIAAEAALTGARDALGTLTGLGGLPLPVETGELAAPVGSEADLVAGAKTRRRDLALKQALVDLAKTQLDIKWMQFLPSLVGSWQLTHQFTTPTGLGSQDRTRWAAFVVLSVPIYTQTRYADLDAGRAAVRKAALEAEDAERNAALEIRQARRDFATAVERIAVAKEQAALARETLDLSEAEYAAGTGSSIEVTDAARASRDAEIGLATRRLEAQLALIRLLHAAGEDLATATGASSPR